MVKPTQIPDFCTNPAIVDPQSGQNNVVEPDVANKPEGWKFQQLPPRGWMNWLHNLYYLWLKFIDEELEPQVVSNAAGVVSNTAAIANNSIAIANLDTDDIANNSTVTGGNVTDALNTLKPTIPTTSEYLYTLKENSGNSTSQANVSTYYDGYGNCKLSFESTFVTTGGTGDTIDINILPPDELKPKYGTGGDEHHIPITLFIGVDPKIGRLRMRNDSPNWLLEYWNGTTFISIFPPSTTVTLRSFSASYIGLTT